MSEEKYKVGEVIEVFAHGDDAKRFWLRRYKMKGYLFDLIDSDTHGMKLKVTGILPEATEEDRLKLVHDFVNLLVKINGGLVQRKGKGHPTAFIDYSGHVNVLYIRVYEDGWSTDHTYDDGVIKYNIDFDDDRFLVKGREVYKELCDKFLGEVTC